MEESQLDGPKRTFKGLQEQQLILGLVAERRELQLGVVVGGGRNRSPGLPTAWREGNFQG